MLLHPDHIKRADFLRGTGFYEFRFPWKNTGTAPGLEGQAQQSMYYE
jgi:hypothetical protein